MKISFTLCRKPEILNICGNLEHLIPSQNVIPWYLHVAIVLKSESLNLLEPSGPVKACNGVALPFLINLFGPLTYFNLNHSNGTRFTTIQFTTKYSRT
jgi:hypothetical protein